MAGALADQKAQLEARAAEAIAAAKAEAEEAISRAEAEAEEKAKTYAQAREEAQARAESEANLRADVEEKLREQIEEHDKLRSQIRMVAIAAGAIEAGTCECCNTEGVPKEQLAAIDSGQLFCPDCLKEFRSCVQVTT